MTVREGAKHATFMVMAVAAAVAAVLTVAELAGNASKGEVVSWRLLLVVVVLLVTAWVAARRVR